MFLFIYFFAVLQQTICKFCHEFTDLEILLYHKLPLKFILFILFIIVVNIASLSSGWVIPTVLDQGNRKGTVDEKKNSRGRECIEGRNKR